MTPQMAAFLVAAWSPMYLLVLEVVPVMVRSFRCWIGGLR